MPRDPQACSYPPHPVRQARTVTAEHDQGQRQGAEAEWETESSLRHGQRSIGRARRWVGLAPAERAPLVAAPFAWTAAEIMHALGTPGLWPAAATAAAAGIAYGVGEKRAKAVAVAAAVDGVPDYDGDGERDDEDQAHEHDGREHPRLQGAELAGSTAAVGAWVTAATLWGPLAGPFAALTTGGLVLGAVGYWWLFRHEALAAARARRDAAASAEAERIRREAEWAERKAEWHRLSYLIGLGGSHLLAVEETGNGEAWHVDIKSTGKLNTQISCGTIAARLAGELNTRRARIEVTPDPEWVYRITVLIRARDTWSGGGDDDGFVWHPYVTGEYDPDSEYADLVTESPSIRDPLTIGADPETHTALTVPLWTPDNGGQRVLVIATSGGGKSAMLNNLCERITACPDARLLQVNLSKPEPDYWWESLAEATVLPDDADAVTRALMVVDFVIDSFKVRRLPPGVEFHEPTPAEPLFILKIDEIDKAAAMIPAGQQLLGEIASKCRSKGWGLILSGQRPVNKAIGGALVRANISQIIWGMMRANDIRNAGGGESIALPDIGGYGGGNPGVFGVCAHPTYPGMPFARGRGFYWGKPAHGMMRLIEARAATRTPYVLEPALAGLADQWAAITGKGPQGAADGPVNRRYDLITSKRGDRSVPGVSTTRAKLAEAAERGTEPVNVPDLTPGQAAAVEADIGARQATFAADYIGDSADLPAEMQAALRQMLSAPDGLTIRPAANALGIHRNRVHRQLTRWKAQKLARVTGRGSNRRWHADGPGTPGPGLYAVPVPPQSVPLPRAAPPVPRATVPAEGGGGPRLARVQSVPLAPPVPVADDDPELSGEVLPPGTFTRPEMIMMAAVWGLRDANLLDAAERARGIGMPETDIREVVDLLVSDREHVEREARRISREAGAPAVPWMGAPDPDEDDDPDEDQDDDEDTAGGAW